MLIADWLLTRRREATKTRRREDTKGDKGFTFRTSDVNYGYNSGIVELRSLREGWKRHPFAKPQRFSKPLRFVKDTENSPTAAPQRLRASGF